MCVRARLPRRIYVDEMLSKPCYGQYEKAKLNISPNNYFHICYKGNAPLKILSLTDPIFQLLSKISVVF